MSFDELLESVDKKDPAQNPTPNPNPAPAPAPNPAPNPAPAEEDLMPIGDDFKAFCDARKR